MDTVRLLATKVRFFILSQLFSFTNNVFLVIRQKMRCEQMRRKKMAQETDDAISWATSEFLFLVHTYRPFLTHLTPITRFQHTTIRYLPKAPPLCLWQAQMAGLDNNSITPHIAATAPTCLTHFSRVLFYFY